MLRTTVAGFAAGLQLTLAAPAQDLSLGAPLQDHMVVQHDAPLALWGRGVPGRRIDVACERGIHGWGSSGRVLEDGSWSLSLKAPGYAEDPFRPFTIEITDGVETLHLEDVLAGEVWLASGQSNMEWPVSEIDTADELKALGRVHGFRMLDVERGSEPEPTADVGGNWAVLAPDSVEAFSGVATHFGLELLEELQVPIGILHTSWGGSSIEAWCSPEALASVGAGQRGLEAWATSAAAAAVERDAWVHPELAPGEAEQWTPCALPADLETVTGAMQGVVWFRCFLPPLDPAGPQAVAISLGPIDEHDETWLDGRPLGSMDDWRAPRRYLLDGYPTGGGVLTVRVENVYGLGGFSGAADDLHVELADGTRLPLNDGWSWRRGATTKRKAANHRPSHLSNAMLTGLEPVPVRGFLWYQGETNADDPAGYAELFPALIHDWRARFPVRDDGPLPFHFVQLANFLPGGDVDWPGLREAQRRTLELPATGMAVTIDVGDPSDIHPTDKRSVGERLARWALARQYGREVVVCGPMPTRAARIDDRLVLELDTFGAALATRDGGVRVDGLEVVGVDGTSHPLVGLLDGDRVLVDLRPLPKGIARPLKVRYAWADDPVSANLTNSLGLPASPFELWIRWTP